MTGPSSHRDFVWPRPLAATLGSVSVVLLLFLPPTLCAQETPDTQRESDLAATVDELIDALNSNRFQKRENAAEELVELGRGVLPILQKRQRRGLKPEQATRLNMIISALEQSGLESRIEAFLDGQPADLDNWDSFEKWFQDSPRSRELFVELLRNYPRIVLKLDGDAMQIDDALRATIEQMSRERVGGAREVTRADLLALLLPAASAEYRADVLVEMYLLSWFHRSVGRELRNDRQWGEPFLRLVAEWMRKTSLGNRSRVLHRALDWQMDLAKPLAIQTLNQNPDPELTARCLQCLARQGVPKDALIVARYLDDDRSLVTVRSMSGSLLSIEVGDVAAASIGFLKSVPVVDLGFAEPIEHPTFGIVYEQIRFPTVTDVTDPKTLEQQRQAVRDAARERLEPRNSKPTNSKPDESTPAGKS
ncbi:MAG: hypothetical protein AAFU85_25475 [Planctomycetota bacterium]